MAIHFMLARYIAFICLLLSATLGDGGTGLLQFEYGEGGLIVESERAEARLSFALAPVGINELMGIKSIVLSYGDESYVTESCTDYIGPYIVSDDEAEAGAGRPAEGEEGTGALKEDFTGGWHSRGEEPYLLPTARSKEVKLYLDGEELGEAGLASTTKSLELVVINEIMAYNSAEPVLEERVSYKFKKGGMDVEINARALRTLTIKTYYGLQAQKPSWAEEVVYHYEDGSKEDHGLKRDSYSRKKSAYQPVSKIEWRSETLPLSFIMKIKRNSALSQGAFLAQDIAWAFTKAYGKSYFNTVNGLHLHLDKGDEIKLSGSYYFKED